MADNPDIKPYPLQFDPSQWANPYTQWNKQALPFMGQYAGVPTDARGNPIQSYLDAQTASRAAQAAAPPAASPGTTLNTSPMQQGPQFAGYMNGANPAIPSAPAFGGSQYAGSQYFGPSPVFMPAPQQPTPVKAAPTAPAGPDMNAAYLAALANPGKVTTPGATVAQSPTPSAQSGVLQQFLQNWKPGANPAGNYNPNLFPDALRGQA
jgi:hypothetical protein